MTATPARDALACYWHVLGTYIDAEHLDRIVRSHGHAAVVAALVESGWRPTADQLRAMGGADARISGASSVPVEADHPIEWLRGRTIVELAFTEFPSPVVMSAECVYFPEGVDGD